MKIKTKTFITICALSFLLLVGYGNLSLDSKEFARELGAAIGASAGVVANEYNTLAQSLREKEVQVNQKEVALARREAAVMEEVGKKDTKLVFVVLFVGLLLLFLILLNFYLDWKRRKMK